MGEHLIFLFTHPRNKRGTMFTGKIEVITTSLDKQQASITENDDHDVGWSRFMIAFTQNDSFAL